MAVIMKKISELNYDGVPGVKAATKQLAKAILRKCYLLPKQQIKRLAGRIYWGPKELIMNRKINKIAKVKLYKNNKIPKIIHYVWLGGGQKPKLTKKYIKTWRKYCPGYEIIEWNEHNYNVEKNRYAREAYSAQKWAFVADFIRLDVLDKFGGIYLDTDVEVLKSFDGLLSNPAFLGFEVSAPGSGQIFSGTGTLASEKSGELIKYLKAYYAPDRSFIQEDGSIDTTTNTRTVTRMISEKYGVEFDNDLQKNKDFVIYPSEYFCPKVWSTRKVLLTKNTFTVHHFAASWLPPEVRDAQHQNEKKL